MLSHSQSLFCVLHHRSLRVWLTSGVPLALLLFVYCGARFVVHRSGDGAMVDCGCGAVMTTRAFGAGIWRLLSDVVEVVLWGVVAVFLQFVCGVSFASPPFTSHPFHPGGGPLVSVFPLLTIVISLCIPFFHLPFRLETDPSFSSLLSCAAKACTHVVIAPSPLLCSLLVTFMLIK